MSFDAVSIENAFARLIGNPIGRRGTPHDADIFRGGNPAHLSEALDNAIDTLEAKVNSKTFTIADSQPGGAKTLIDGAISRLRKISAVLANSSAVEREDYHWEIIGSLISIVAILLERVD